jgi:hypothetical protein
MGPSNVLQLDEKQRSNIDRKVLIWRTFVELWDVSGGRAH